MPEALLEGWKRRNIRRNLLRGSVLTKTPKINQVLSVFLFFFCDFFVDFMQIKLLGWCVFSGIC